MPGGDTGTLLNLLLGGGLIATITAIVAAIRKWKAGEIVDDDAIIARLDRDNANLRELLDKRTRELDEERAKRFQAEDDAAEARRQLLTYKNPVDDNENA